jgi:hypothetical protein
MQPIKGRFWVADLPNLTPDLMTTPAFHCSQNNGFQ